MLAHTKTLSPTKTQNLTPSPSRSAPGTPSTDEQRTKALSKPVSFYESKSRSVHAAILEIWGGAPFLEVATKYKQTPENLASAIAVFAKQAMDLTREKGVVCHHPFQLTPFTYS